MTDGFMCSTCGQWHDELPMSFGPEAPYWYDIIGPQERPSRAELGSDQCIIDHQHFFIRACLEIPVIDATEPFTWGVWVSLSEQNFGRMSELWETDGRDREPPYFGWLSTALPCYPDTLSLKTHVYTRSVGQLPPDRT